MFTVDIKQQHNNNILLPSSTGINSIKEKISRSKFFPLRVESSLESFHHQMNQIKKLQKFHQLTSCRMLCLTCLFNFTKQSLTRKLDIKFTITLQRTTLKKVIPESCFCWPGQRGDKMAEKFEVCIFTSNKMFHII